MTPTAAPQHSYPQNSPASPLVEGLQAPLRSALTSLNINLDYELARYRYAKRGEAQPRQGMPAWPPQRRSPALVEMPQVVNPAPRSVTPPPPPPNPRIATQGGGDRPPSPAAPPLTEVAALRSALVRQPLPSPTTDMASSAALRHEFEAPPSPFPAARVQPPTKNWLPSLNTPLGLGALMLLLVASAGFGFLLVNPSVAQNLVRHTPLARWWADPTEAEVPTTIASDEATAAAPSNFDGLPLDALGPDLSQQEFTNLDLNRLSNLPSTSSGPELAEGAPTAGEAPLAAAAAMPSVANAAPSRPQEVNAMPQTTTRAPRPAAIAPPVATPAPASAPLEAAPPPAAATPSAPTASSDPISAYYVVTDYTGDPSLESVREYVDDAYVRNFEAGARIQLGAFNTAEGASALVEELQDQGIDAQLYEP